VNHLDNPLTGKVELPVGYPVAFVQIEGEKGSRQPDTYQERDDADGDRRVPRATFVCRGSYD
jgi:hypothetical protein